ncbi:MAG: lantibiotic dehydratase [Deltaproteobacteria bacterium]|nr:lantibiotic dehydratase [Deltaproteobacteria bacterium]
MTALVADAGVVLRTPLLPFDTLLAWTELAGDPATARRFLVELVARPEVREALFVASPSLHEGLARWRAEPDSAAGQRAELAIVRYLARMAGRATPFGLFSGVSPGAIGPATELRLAPRGELRRRTRLDNDYLFALVDALAKAPAVRTRLTYHPADSLYEVAGRLRYAQPRLAGKERSYHLVAVERTPYLDATLARARGGARLADLAAGLVADDPTVTLDEAAAYLDELVDEHLLAPALGVVVTGPEPLDALLAQLAAAGLDEPHGVLAGARARLGALDGTGAGNDPARYEDIASVLAPLPAKVEMSRLFQVDLVRPASVVLGTRVAADVARAIEWLRQIHGGTAGAGLEDFRRAFAERYEARRVPLLEALDDEAGIGFETARDPGAEGAPLLAGLAWPARRGEHRVRFGAPELHLQARLAGALAAGATELVLSDDDLAALRTDHPPPLPDAMSALIRLAGAPGDETILLEGAAGPSGARLLGRFCHASPEIDAMVRAHLAAEEALRPGAVFAEVVHLNEGRIGNILCRPVLRGHEIVFLGISGAAAGAQITLDDLEVSVAGARVVLTSKRLGAEVLPRLSTAHNFRLRSLGVYRFLCALQTQDCAGGVGFAWGPLARMPYLPRVRLGRVVLHRAQWFLRADELEPLTRAVREARPRGKAGMPAAERAKILAAVAALRDRRGLPRFVALADGDHELPIDLDNPALAHAFADDLSGRTEGTFVELFPAPGALPVRGDDGAYTNELVVTFTRKPAATVPAPAPQPVMAPALPRSFRPGSSWLYAKVYTGASTADHAIRQGLAQLVRDAMGAGHADRWFFVRYHDPDPHLRLRFRGDPARLAAHVLPALEAAVAPLATSGLVRKVVLDTYERELERYGGDLGMELCEEVFWRDSECAAAIVELLDGDAGGDARWRLALRGSDALLVALGFSPEARRRIFAGARDALGAEHDAGASFYAQLGERFKKERAALEASFAPTEEHDLWPGFELLAARDAHLAPIGAELRARLGARFDDLAGSLVHMHCNRLLHASHRAQELVLYDFLRRLHDARRARRP